MGVKAVSMETRLAVTLAERVDEGLDVTAVCRKLGISRQTYYVYRRRFAAEGVAGLVPRSRAPMRHPNQTPVVVEEAIVAWWYRLKQQGWDHGARSIWARMERAGQDPPHPRTVHRVLVRRGLAEQQPQKRPRSSYRRFTAAAPNGIWQLDGTETTLADGTTRVVLTVLDDHSRMRLASVVADTEDAASAWVCLERSIAKHGVPAMFLSDNSLAFNGSRKGIEVLVERNLRELGVAVVAATPKHPQTCGKAEREHRTMQRWLAAQPAPATEDELLRLVTVYTELYNTERPHQSLGEGPSQGLLTPNDAYAATPKAQPAPGPAPTRKRITQVKVTGRGEVSAGWYRVQIGRGWEGVTVTVIRDGLSVAIFHHTELIETRILDPDRRYQPNGRRPIGGQRRLPRQPTSPPKPPVVLSAM